MIISIVLRLIKFCHAEYENCERWSHWPSQGYFHYSDQISTPCPRQKGATLDFVITFTVVKLFSKFLKLATSHIFLHLLMHLPIRITIDIITITLLCTCVFSFLAYCKRGGRVCLLLVIGLFSHCRRNAEYYEIIKSITIPTVLLFPRQWSRRPVHISRTWMTKEHHE